MAKATSKAPKSITVDEWMAVNMKPAAPRPANSFTINEAAQKLRMTRSGAYLRVKQLEKEGKVISGESIENGKRIRYFVPIL